MKIIGMDSSGNVASVAYVADGVLIAEYTMNHKKTHSQTLLPMLDQIVRDAGIELSEIDAIAVAAGPGSFTGLRIGAATVKGLGLALEKPVISVPTCEGLAYNLAGTSGLVVPIMDARRGQVYTGIYRVDPGRTGCPVIVEDQMALSIEKLLDKLVVYGEPVTFLGDGVPVFRKAVEDHCKVPFTFAPPQSALQRAASVAALGEHYAMAEMGGTAAPVLTEDPAAPMHTENPAAPMHTEDSAASGLSDGGKKKNVGSHVVSADEFKPIYLRKSQAEREHEAAAKARRVQDLTDVAAMEQEMFSDAWSMNTLTDSIRYPYNHILLISTEGEIRPLVSEEDVADSFVVGEEEKKTAGYLIYADPAGEAELHRIAVRPEYRRKGLARKLMAELLERTGHPVSEKTEETADGAPIFLEVRAGNAAAIALYLAYGFQEIDRRKNYYHDPDEDALIMKKR